MSKTFTQFRMPKLNTTNRSLIFINKFQRLL